MGFQRFAPMRRFGGLAIAGAVLSACASGAELGTERPELGDFRLGHAVVVAEGATVGPLSRRVEPEQWVETLRAEVERRFGRYDGRAFYHIAVSVDGYVLAVPGVPLVAAPRSALIVGVTIWDDAAGGKINEEPHQITVLESLSGETLVGSGLTQSADEQMANLAQNAVLAIERWMASNPDWFDAPETGPPDSEAAPVADVAVLPDVDVDTAMPDAEPISVTALDDGGGNG